MLPDAKQPQQKAPELFVLLIWGHDYKMQNTNMKNKIPKILSDVFGITEAIER